MIKISILYPNTKTARFDFDFDYYLNQHIPLATKLLGEHSGYKGVSVERGLSGAMPNTEATYLCNVSFSFRFQRRFYGGFHATRRLVARRYNQLHRHCACY